MLRIRAIRQILLEDIAGLSQSREERDDESLKRARKRAVAVVVVDWAAIVILVLARAKSGSVLPVGPTEDSIFALGLLAIAAHSGFRLGQLEKLSAVDRTIRELDARAAPQVESEAVD
ncbi:MAG: hypothetical protein ACE5GX_05490 [Thermoanaerobaculia bacterium]